MNGILRLFRPMKILLHSLLIVVAAGLGLAVGFAFRGKRISEPAEPPTVTFASPTLPQEKPEEVISQPTGVRLRDDSPLATRLERDLAKSTGVNRWLYWLAAVEKAGLGDFPRLARLAQGNATAMRFVAARWVELDPRHLFDTLAATSKSGRALPADELATVLFEEWPKRDPDAVVAALNEPGDFGTRHDWRLSVASTLIAQDAERGLRLLSEWHLENYGPRMTAVARWAAVDPRHAAEFTLENPAGYASRLAMETIGKAWAKADPVEALGFAATKPGELGSALATATLKAWAGRNLNEAADWLAGVDARTRNRLSSGFVEVWAKQDASSALAWCEKNLAGSARAQAVGAVLKGVAEEDPAGAADLVTEMAPSPARSEAARAVARQWFPELSSGKTVPSETVAWLAGLDAESVKRVLEEIQWTWATSDPKSMAAFLASASAEQIPAHADSILARQMARKNPSETLAWASRLPAERALAAGSEAFSEWRRAQPETAMKWLNDLPSADARRQPYFESAIRTLAYDPQAAEQLTAMTAPDRAAARRVIESMSLPEERRTKLLDALKTH